MKNKSQYISFISQITKNLFIIGISELENIALYEFIENLLHQDLNTVLIEDNNVYLDIYSGISFISETPSNKCLVEEASIALEYCLENPTHKHQYYSNKIVDYFKRQIKIDYLHTFIWQYRR